MIRGWSADYRNTNIFLPVDSIELLYAEYFLQRVDRGTFTTF